MTEFITTLTQRGQVTVPVEVRRLLGLKRGDKVACTIVDGRVQLTPIPFTLETAYRSVPPLANQGDFEEIVRVAKEERAERAVRSLRGR